MWTKRVYLDKQDGESYKALLALASSAEKSAANVGLDPLLVELVKIRTSQINGCAYCLRMHVRDAIKKGETADRLAVLAAWRESQYFSAVEEAALSLAEGITLIASTPVSDDAYAAAAEVLDPAQIAAISWLATVMNAFNRISIMSHYPVAP